MQHLILVATILVVILAIVTISTRTIVHRKTVSQHIASSPRLIVLARIGLPLANVLALIWFFGWYVTGHSIGTAVKLLFAVVCAAGCMLGLFPYIERTKSGRLHDKTAWAFVLMLPLLLGVWSVHEVGVPRVVSLAAMIIQICLLVLFVWSKKARQYFFVLESVYVALFGLALLAVTYE